MEKTMRRFTLLLLVALLGGTDRLAAQETVETRGIRSEVKIEEVIFGHLTELNGKFKLRATELTFAPDGYVGVHHHVGPGIRYLHCCDTEQDKTDRAHGSSPVRLLRR